MASRELIGEECSLYNEDNSITPSLILNILDVYSMMHMLYYVVELKICA